MANARSTKEVVIICFFWMITAVMVTYALVTNLGDKGSETGGQTAPSYSQQGANAALEEKIGTYEGVLKNDPGNIQAMIGLGDLYFDNSSYHKAIEVFLKASEVGEPSVHVENDLGLLYLNVNETDKALLRFQKAFGIDSGHVDSLFYIGMIYQHKGQNDKAKKAYDQVLATKPSAQLVAKVKKQLETLGKE